LAPQFQSSEPPKAVLDWWKDCEATAIAHYRKMLPSMQLPPESDDVFAERARAVMFEGTFESVMTILEDALVMVGAAEAMDARYKHEFEMAVLEGVRCLLGCASWMTYRHLMWYRDGEAPTA